MSYFSARVAIMVLLAMGAQVARAETPAPTPLGSYRLKSLTLRYDPGFMSPFAVYRGEQEVRLGLFGAEAPGVFAGSEEALRLMERYRTKRVWGFALWTVGLTALVANLVILIADPEAVVDREFGLRPLYWGLLGGGVLFGAGGGMLMSSANRDLSEATRRYNADLARRLEGRQAVGPGLRVRVGLRW